ncbi:hypothetical protein [Rhodopseudomonas sp. RCAM05734]|uniref:hypothetical protein n=1 Tax=Rhodopseudomonas sp. RCAM05734 TaxID=3457549 RepID=UPI00404426A9
MLDDAAGSMWTHSPAVVRKPGVVRERRLSVRYVRDLLQETGVRFAERVDSGQRDRHDLRLQ